MIKIDLSKVILTASDIIPFVIKSLAIEMTVQTEQPTKK